MFVKYNRQIFIEYKKKKLKQEGSNSNNDFFFKQKNR